MFGKRSIFLEKSAFCVYFFFLFLEVLNKHQLDFFCFVRLGVDIEVEHSRPFPTKISKFQIFSNGLPEKGLFFISIFSLDSYFSSKKIPSFTVLNKFFSFMIIYFFEFGFLVFCFVHWIRSTSTVVLSFNDALCCIKPRGRKIGKLVCTIHKKSIFTTLKETLH